jgi:hypothetical protein
MTLQHQREAQHMLIMRLLFLSVQSCALQAGDYQIPASKMTGNLSCYLLP